jgi:hypothetical protein
MHALLTLGIYITPFILIGVAVKYWMMRSGIGLSDVQAEGNPERKRSRFLLGIWRQERRD